MQELSTAVREKSQPSDAQNNARQDITYSDIAPNPKPHNPIKG